MLPSRSTTAIDTSAVEPSGRRICPRARRATARAWVKSACVSAMESEPTVASRGGKRFKSEAFTRTQPPAPANVPVSARMPDAAVPKIVPATIAASE